MSTAENSTLETVKYVDFSRLSLWTATPGVEGKRARLTFGTRDGNPRITVFTNDPRDTIGKGVIIAAMNAETFLTFLNLLETAYKSKQEFKAKVDCYTTRWENNVRTNDRILNSEVWLGRDADGIVWISVIADNRPKIRFNFKMSEWHNVFIDGKQISESEASALEASAKHTLLSETILKEVLQNLSNKPIITNGNSEQAKKTQQKIDSFSTDEVKPSVEKSDKPSSATGDELFADFPF